MCSEVGGISRVTELKAPRAFDVEIGCLSAAAELVSVRLLSLANADGGIMTTCQKLFVNALAYSLFPPYDS